MLAKTVEKKSNVTYVFKLHSDSVSRWSMFKNSRKKLPVGDLSLVSSAWVHSTEIEVDESFLTEDGHSVKVLDKSFGFMDVSVLVEYENDALRWLSLESMPFRKPVNA